MFGGEYPGGALYTRADWIAKNEATVQKLTNAIIATLKWIHSHTPEEIMAKMPDELVGPDKALYLAALKNTIPMYSTDRQDGPEGRAGRARGVQPVGAGDRQGEHRPVEDLHQPLRRGGRQGNVTAAAITAVDRRDHEKRLDHLARRDHAPAAFLFCLMVRA